MDGIAVKDLLVRGIEFSLYSLVVLLLIERLRLEVFRKLKEIELKLVRLQDKLMFLERKIQKRRKKDVKR